MNTNKTYRSVTFALLSLVFLEAIFSQTSLIGGILLAHPEPSQFFAEHGWHITFSALLYGVILILVLAAFGLYNAKILIKKMEQIPRLILAMFFTMLLVAQLSYFIPSFDLGQKTWCLVLLLNLGKCILLRHLFIQRASHELFKKRILVLGAGTKALMLRQSVESGSFNSHIVGYVNIRGERERLGGKDVIYSVSSLYDYVKQHQIDEVVAAVDDRRNGFPLEQLLECRLNGVEVSDLLHFYERELGQVQLDILDPSWLIFSKGFKQLPAAVYSKRVIDCVLATVVLTLSLPLMLVGLLLICLQNGYRQPWLIVRQYYGQSGMPIDLYNFACKEEGLGRLLRKLNFHRLALWFNVLSGELSVVGPKPIHTQADISSSKNMAYFSERHLVKPGLFGWAQVNGVFNAQVSDNLHYDLYYVKNQSLFLDFVIMMKKISRQMKINTISVSDVINEEANSRV